MKNSWMMTLVLLVALAVGGYFLWPYAFTVVSIQQVEEVKLSETFDPQTYVDGIWSSRIIPTILENAVDLSIILSEFDPNEAGLAAKDDLVAVANDYGLITVGEAHVYQVKGTGLVTSVDTSKSTGIAEIQVDGYNGPILVRLYIGTRIPSDETSVRDAVGFITFGDFKEQTEYGKVGAEINKRLLTEVLEPLDKDQLLGRQISFFGAMTIRTFNLINIDLKQVNIVPVQIELQQ
jgi:predicted lipoprotein